ncbi:CBS domain-containing protein [Pleurocapsales cyanobacterium LEGE 06147]|nr:CBS domain-containing protein [Pleurocapsales cyanobacterium LEGE 06147]
MFLYSSALEQIITHSPPTVAPELSLLEVLAIMNQSIGSQCVLIEGDEDWDSSLATIDCSSYVLVTEADQLVGIFTERDLVRITANRGSLARLKNLSIREVMTKPVITLKKTEYRDIFTVLSILRQHRIRHLPVTDECGKLVGAIAPETLRHALQPENMFRLRSLSEVMSTEIIHAAPTTSVIDLARLMIGHRVSCVVITETLDNDQQQAKSLLKPVGIVTERDLLQFQVLKLNIARIQATEVMSSPLLTLSLTDSLWIANQKMQQKRVRHLVVTGNRGELLGIVTQTSLLRSLDPLELYKVVTLLQQQFESDRLLDEIVRQIRQSLDLEEILNATVKEVKQFLQTDRVLIYRLNPDRSGEVVAEAVDRPWQSILGSKITAHYVPEQWIRSCLKSRVKAIADIYQSDFQPCQIELLEQYQVRASIIMPIIPGEPIAEKQESLNSLWGLLIVHHCASSRKWENFEIELLQKLAIRVAIAIQQATIFEKSRAELQQWQQKEAEIRQLNSELQQQLFEGTTQLEATNQELQNEIKERKRTEKALQKARDELEKRVEERTAELEETNELLRQEIYIRLQTELELRHERNFVSAILGVAGALIVVMDCQGRIVRCNQACERITGYGFAEIASKYFWEILIDPDEIDRVKKIFERVKNFQFPYQSENYWLTKNGDRLLITWSTTALVDEEGKVEYLIVAGKDITERQQAEEALRQSEERLREITENISEVFFMIAPHSAEILYISSAYERIWGRSCQSLYANPQSWLLAIHPEDYAQAVSTLETQFRTGEEFQEEYRIIRPDGSIRWVWTRAFPIRDRADKVSRFVGIAEDITERKQAENILKQLTEELETRVEERTLQLSEINQQLQQEILERKQAESKIKASLTEKEILLKEIHHRVKNNLLVAASLLDFQADNVEEPEIVKMFEDSQRRIHSMALIHEQLYQSENLAQVDFAKYLTVLTNKLSSSYDLNNQDNDNKQGIQFLLDINTVYLNIETAQPCGLIVNELISNAIKHAFSERRLGKIWLKLHQDCNQKIILSVKDNGIGFPEDLDFTSTDSLGMQLVCTLTEQIEGKIELIRDKGTEFRLLFSELNYQRRV